jgi:hypothetical protein
MVIGVATVVEPLDVILCNDDRPDIGMGMYGGANSILILPHALGITSLQGYCRRTSNPLETEQ